MRWSRSSGLGATVRIVGWVEPLRTPSFTSRITSRILSLLRPVGLMGFGKSREERALPLPILRSVRLTKRLPSHDIEKQFDVERDDDRSHERGKHGDPARGNQFAHLAAI